MRFNAITDRPFIPRITFLRRVISLCFFSILTVVAGNFILLSLPQATETIEAFDTLENDAPLALFPDPAFWLFLLSFAFWAVCTWYCARLLLGKRFPYESLGHCVSARFAAWAVQWIPRSLGLLACIPVTAYFCSGKSHVPYLWVPLVGFTLVFLVFVVFRRRGMFGSLASGWEQRRGEQFPRFDKINRTGRVAVGILFTLSWMLYVAIYAGHAPVARFIGAPAILLFALGSWTLFGGLVLVYMPKLVGGPSLALAPFGLAAVVSLWNENHYVAQDGSIPNTVVAREPLVEHFSNWRKARGVHDDEPIFLIATAGGASRAAFWTGHLLSTLEDQARADGKRFAPNIYAISGVSGGGLGAAAFLGALAHEQVTGKRMQPSIAEFSRTFLGMDFLSPVLGYMLYPDLLQRFNPFRCFSCDRSKALENTWEKDWDTIARMSSVESAGDAGSRAAAQNWFAQPMSEMYRQSPRYALPSLFLNATSMADGHRIVQSNIAYAPPQAYDLFDNGLDTGKLRLSGAVHNSARFAYLSPAGLVFTRQEHRPWDYVVDGGYFENSGAATVNAIIHQLVISGSAKPDDFVVIVIENDPADNGNWMCSRGRPVTTPKVYKREWLVEVTAPPATLYRTRSARAAAAEDEAVRLLAGCEKRQVIELRYPKMNEKLPPMSWYLNSATQNRMRSVLTDEKSNSNSLRMLREHWRRIQACIRDGKDCVGNLQQAAP